MHEKNVQANWRFFAYKIQAGQPLRNTEKKTGIMFCASILATVYDDPEFLSNA